MQGQRRRIKCKNTKAIKKKRIKRRRTKKSIYLLDEKRGINLLDEKNLLT